MTVFTTQERRVLYFLLASIVVGALTGIVRRSGLLEGERPAGSDLRPWKPAARRPAPAEGEKTTKLPVEIININVANQKEFESLPTIGPVTAERILAYRKSEGPFHSVDDLVKVKGIGPKTLEKIRPYVSL